ncbi:hypothetical protein HGRIS_013955 [Hohenbuehelia grisea]|uniref:Protein kinase domain-containing protein n=1 Tax=Hohenbuehelia grisea TaxID=104357 RepID=A0ABR3JU07_9AGAR
MPLQSNPSVNVTADSLFQATYGENLSLRPESNILDSLRNLFPNMMHVLLTHPASVQLVTQNIHLIMPALLDIRETQESDVTMKHAVFAERTWALAKALILQDAVNKGIDPEEVTRSLAKFHIKHEYLLPSGKPDAMLVDDMTGRGAPIEIKASRHFDIARGSLVLDKGLDGINAPTQRLVHFRRQLFGYAYDSGINLCLATGMQNGTWLTGTDQQNSVYPGENFLFYSENITPQGMNTFDRFWALVEVEVLFFIYAVHRICQDECIQKLGRPVPLLFHNKIKNDHLRGLQHGTSSGTSMMATIMGTILTFLTAFILLMLGPSVICSRWVSLYISLDHRAAKFVQVEPLSPIKARLSISFPLFLQTAAMMGWGLHGRVMSIKWTSLAIKAAPVDVLAHESKFYELGEPKSPSFMLRYYGTFRFTGPQLAGFGMMILELGSPIHNWSDKDFEDAERVVEKMHQLLGVHHHDIAPRNFVRGIRDQHMRIVDFAQAGFAEDCAVGCQDSLCI